MCHVDVSCERMVTPWSTSARAVGMTLVTGYHECGVTIAALYIHVLCTSFSSASINSSILNLSFIQAPLSSSTRATLT